MVCRVGARTFMPLRSASDLICLFVVWNTPGPWTCVAMSFTSANSFGAYCWTYSQSALLVPTGSFIMNGSSNTSTSGKRPAV